MSNNPKYNTKHDPKPILNLINYLYQFINFLKYVETKIA
jgi:hypothetical protein